MNWIIYIALGLFLLYLSGRRKRPYLVAPNGGYVDLKDGKIDIETLAKQYQPILYQLEGLRGYDPEKILYEVIDKDIVIVINYYNFWKNEIHPQVIIHYLYCIFRFIRYGSCADIEFVQIIIDKNSGEILEVNAESDSHNNPDTFFSDHIKFKIKKTDDLYELFLDSKFIKNVSLPREENRIKILVITWNHVYGFYEEQKSVCFPDLPLYYLSPQLYAKYRIGRRSKG